MDTKKLRQKILDLAIHGKLVPQDPNDEPASVLLERIRAEKERLIAEGKIKRSKKSDASDTSHYENVPFEVPEGWCWCTVEDVFELNPKNKVEDNVICGFIPMALVDDGFGYAHSFEERPWGEVKKGYCHFQNGDIGIAKISPCFENRKSTIFSGLPNGIGAGTTELSILRGSLVDCRFFLFLFQTEWYLREGTKYFKGVVGQQRVNKEIFTTLQIPLPPLAEQRRISNAIESYMSLCSEIDEYRDGVHSAIIASKVKILDLAIHGKLVPQDPNDEPASELLKRINPKAVGSCDNPQYGKVPSSWVISTVGETFTINPKTHVEDDTEAAFVPMTCVADGYSNTFEYECRKWGDIKKGFVHFQENDVAVAKISPCLENRKSVVFHDLPNGIGAGTTELNVFRCGEILPEYALFYFKSQMFIGSCAGTYNGVVGQQRVAKSFIQELPIGIPPYKEQLRIVSKVNELFSQLDMIEKSLQA